MRYNVKHWGRSPEPIRLPYLVGVPETMREGERFPLIVYLHGAGNRGDNPDILRTSSLIRRLETDRVPCIVLAPQCPADEIWYPYLRELALLAEEVGRMLPVDGKRVSLTGASMGGYAAWELAMYRPELFCALAPVCGGGMRWRAERLRSIPVWAFHGEKDPVVPVIQSVQMVDAVNASGGSARLTVFPGVGHDSWVPTYEKSGLPDWLLRQKTGNRNG